MSSNLGDNFYVYGALPLDAKQMKPSINGAVPYSSVTDANTQIILNHRYVGLTVLVNDGSGTKEYWYKDGVEDENLVAKGSTSLMIPKPIVEYRRKGGHSNNGVDSTSYIALHFTGCPVEWLSHTPRIFLFRYKKHRRRYRPERSWVHPSDNTMIDANVWEGSAYYNGKQKDFSDNSIDTRRTEWFLGAAPNDTSATNTYPLEFLPYHRKEIELNLMQYWNGVDGFDFIGFPVAELDIDIRHNYVQYHLTKGNRRSTGGDAPYPTRVRVAKNQFIRFAYGINNPDYTPTNNQAPIIFGEMSDVLCIYPVKRGDYKEMGVRIGYTKNKIY